MFSTCPVVDTAQPNLFLGAVQLRYLPTLVPSVQVEAYGGADAKNLEQLSLEIHETRGYTLEDGKWLFLKGKLLLETHPFSMIMGGSWWKLIGTYIIVNLRTSHDSPSPLSLWTCGGRARALHIFAPLGRFSLLFVAC